MVDPLPKAGLCIQLDENLYCETEDGQEFTCSSPKANNEVFTFLTFNQSPIVEELHRQTKDALKAYLSFQGMLNAVEKPCGIGKREPKEPPDSKIVGGKILFVEGQAEEPSVFQKYLEGANPGNWEWSDGTHRIRTYDNGSVEEITDYPDGQFHRLHKDNECISQDTRPDYIQEALTSNGSNWSLADGLPGKEWEATYLFQGSYTNKYIWLIRSSDSSTQLIYDPLENWLYPHITDTEWRIQIEKQFGEQWPVIFGNIFSAWTLTQQTE